MLYSTNILRLVREKITTSLNGWYVLLNVLYTLLTRSTVAAVHVHLEVGERKQNSGTENPHGVLDRELKGFDINYISHSGKDRKEGLQACIQRFQNILQHI